jgi:hypothetical protein
MQGAFREDLRGRRKDPEGDRKDPEGDRKDPEGDRKDPEGDRKDPEGDRDHPAGRREDPRPERPGAWVTLWTGSLGNAFWGRTVRTRRGLVLVVYTERSEDTVRIISARWAIEKERALYLEYMEKRS